jgi:hypothetical protein
MVTNRQRTDGFGKIVTILEEEGAEHRKGGVESVHLRIGSKYIQGIYMPFRGQRIE